MAEKKKEERTLEMRVAELEELLGVRPEEMEVTEQEAAAYNKIADALGVDPCRVPSCRLPSCRVNSCRLQPCRMPPCRVQPCRIQTCIVLCHPGQGCRKAACIFHQCIDQCIAGYPGDYEGDLSGGFGMLGYPYY